MNRQTVTVIYPFVKDGDGYSDDRDVSIAVRADSVIISNMTYEPLKLDELDALIDALNEARRLVNINKEKF